MEQLKRHIIILLTCVLLETPAFLTFCTWFGQSFVARTDWRTAVKYFRFMVVKIFNFSSLKWMWILVRAREEGSTGSTAVTSLKYRNCVLFWNCIYANYKRICAFFPLGSSCSHWNLKVNDNMREIVKSGFSSSLVHSKKKILFYW